MMRMAPRWSMPSSVIEHPVERVCGVWDCRQTGTGLVETCRALCVCVMPRVCRVCARRDAS
eukprot:4039631-Prymnesium_polylepis.1